MKIIKSLFLFSSFFFLVSPVFAATQIDLNKAIEEKIRVLQETNAQVEKTQKEIEGAKGQKRTLKQELQRLDYGINQLNLSIRSAEINISKLSLELEVFQFDIDETEREIAVKQLAIKKFLRHLQQRDRESLTVAFLKRQSLAGLFFELQGMNLLNQQFSDEVIGLQKLQASLESKFVERSNKKSQVETENRNLKHRRGILSDQKENRGVLLAETQSKEKLYQKQLEELEKKQLVIGVEIEKIEEELRRTFDPSILPIKRPGVLAKPVSGPISQEYGHTSVGRRLYKNGFHNGVDFGVPLGTPVYAAADGEVAAVGNNGRLQYGKYILIRHNNNLSTLYAHLSSQQVGIGQKINRGDFVGYTGTTGYSFGPHLHFTVYWAPSVRLEKFSNCNCGLVPLGITIDPLDYL